MTDGVYKNLQGAVESLELSINSTDRRSPGLAMRVDRIEQKIVFLTKILAWIGSGGLAGLLGTLVLLYRILQAMDNAGS